MDFINRFLQTLTEAEAPVKFALLALIRKLLANSLEYIFCFPLQEQRNVVIYQPGNSTGIDSTKLLKIIPHLLGKILVIK
jgi:hypothetical protein